MYNDEVHSFQDIISLLVDCIDVSEESAAVIAGIVDSRGLALIKCYSQSTEANREDAEELLEKSEIRA